MPETTKDFDINKKIDEFISGSCTDAYKFLGCHKEKGAFAAPFLHVRHFTVPVIVSFSRCILLR